MLCQNGKSSTTFAGVLCRSLFLAKLEIGIAPSANPILLTSPAGERIGL